VRWPAAGALAAAGLLAAASGLNGIAAAGIIGTAALTRSPAVARLVALVAVAVGSWVAGTLITRWGARNRLTIIGPVLRNRVKVLALLCGATAMLSLSWLLLTPGGITPDPMAGMQWLPRPDETRLAVHVTRAATARQPPLIHLHGGPGVADMAHDVPAFARLATDRDVYVYDRIGTGASTRLTDPTGYTTARAVADLDAVRELTGADRVVLHGHSAGALIAVAYLQSHPAHVAALVLSAPGELALDGNQPRPGDLTTRLDGTERATLYLRLGRPRNLFTYALTAVDPHTAHTLAPDREMDRRFAEIYAESTGALFCDRALSGRVGTSGVGYYAHYFPQLHADPTDVPIMVDRLRNIQRPVLLIKPACDYVPWSTANYRRAFPGAQLVMLPDAGHVAYLEQHDRYVDLVEAFLAGRALPLPTITGDQIPDGYRGTR
jgi:proline iminopeptidase